MWKYYFSEKGQPLNLVGLPEKDNGRMIFDDGSVHLERQWDIIIIAHISNISLCLATCINTSHVVWVHGTFPFGNQDDNIVFCLRLQRRPVQGERVGDECAYKRRHTGSSSISSWLALWVREREPANGWASHAHHLILDAIAEMLHFFASFKTLFFSALKNRWEPQQDRYTLCDLTRYSIITGWYLLDHHHLQINHTMTCQQPPPKHSILLQHDFSSWYGTFRNSSRHVVENVRQLQSSWSERKIPHSFPF
jgi:hypothetical protein